MTTRCLLVFILVFIFFNQLPAQQQIIGKIYDGQTDSIISGVSIFNKSKNINAFSDAYGRYSIPAAEGDTIIFSATGYIPDTIGAAFHHLLTAFDVTLVRKIITLEMVRLISDYSADSLARRNYYRHIYNQPGITGRNRPDNGVGISLSPVSYFSKESKQKRALKKRLVKQEQDAYIDLCFPTEWVAKLTGLRDDSLNLFMYRYRPSYNYCREKNRQEILIYINDKLKEFRKSKGVSYAG